MILSNGTVLAYKGGLNPQNFTYETLLFEGVSTVGFFSLSEEDRKTIEKLAAGLIRKHLQVPKNAVIKLVRASPSFSLTISGANSTYTVTLHIMMEIQGDTHEAQK